MKIYEIIEVLEKSKIFYIELVKDKKVVGMCFPIAHTLGNILNERVYYNDIDIHIPEFNPKFLTGESKLLEYWWPLNDVKSRIQAFDRLINIYKNKL